MADIETRLRAKLADIPGARFTVGPPDSGVKMQLVLKSDDPVALLASARKAERELRTLEGVGNISSSASLVRPEIIVRPDSARAADLGVTAASIGETVRVATAGDYDTSLPKLNLSERQVPIRVKLPDAVRADLAAIERLTVPGKNGPVMLGTVATLSMESGPAQIDRLNRSRNVTLDVELGQRQLGGGPRLADLDGELRRGADRDAALRTIEVNLGMDGARAGVRSGSAARDSSGQLTAERQQPQLHRRSHRYHSEVGLGSIQKYPHLLPIDERQDRRAGSREAPRIQLAIRHLAVKGRAQRNPSAR